MPAASPGKNFTTANPGESPNQERVNRIDQLWASRRGITQPARFTGGLCDRPVARPQLIDEFLPKVEEWMEHSKGKIQCHLA